MVILETLCGSVLEFDAKEIAKIRRRSSAQLDGESRGVVSYGIAMSTCVCKIGGKHTNALEIRVVLDDASLVEERNECLVGRLNQQELKRIAIE
jgi:hypothetical protein